MTLHDLIALAGMVVVGSALVLAAPGMRRAPPAMAVLVFALVTTLLVVPVGGLPVGGYVRGVTGDFSITTVCLALAFIAARRGVATPAVVRDGGALRAFVALLALALYPMTLGLTLADPYRLGFGEPWFLGALLLVASIAWMRGFVRIPAVIALAVLAWAGGLLESTNLWDYLVDPFIATWALVRTTIGAYRRLRLARSSRLSASGPVG